VLQRMSGSSGLLLSRCSSPMTVVWSCSRYADAARIRDDSYSGIVGWWAGRGEQDPYGHLLHVSAGYGCYTGRAYLPRQLTEIRVRCDACFRSARANDGRIARVHSRGRSCAVQNGGQRDGGLVSGCISSAVLMLTHCTILTRMQPCRSMSTAGSWRRAMWTRCC
jgi:hypothetical protein